MAEISSFSEHREPILIIFDVLESYNCLLFIFVLFLKLESNPLDKPVVFRARFEISWQISVIFRSRQLRTLFSISKHFVIPPYFICDVIRNHSGPYTMIFAWFSIFWASIWNGRNIEARFEPVEQWNQVSTSANRFRIHSWYLRTHVCG